ncbi:MAG: hypothetical protein FWG39_02540 [Alphaproteobacteria bacterium]|nr:hypothetical protein [Alphaproteobacteria bacterium]
MTNSEKFQLARAGLNNDQINYLDGLGFTFDEINKMLAAGFTIGEIEFCRINGFSRIDIDTEVATLIATKKAGAKVAKNKEIRNKVADVFSSSTGLDGLSVKDMPGGELVSGTLKGVGKLIGWIIRPGK